MLRPISRLTHEITIILPQAPAWDGERIDAEIAEIEAGESSRWRSRDEHPVWRYWTGESRYDLATAREWLRDGETPTVFRCRWLSRHAWVQLRQLEEARGFGAAAAWLAVDLGLVSATGLPGFDTWEPPKRESAAEALAEILGREIIESLGMAIIRANKDLTEPEKKA